MFGVLVYILAAPLAITWKGKSTSSHFSLIFRLTFSALRPRQPNLAASAETEKDAVKDAKEAEEEEAEGAKEEEAEEEEREDPVDNGKAVVNARAVAVADAETTAAETRGVPK